MKGAVRRERREVGFNIETKRGMGKMLRRGGKENEMIGTGQDIKTTTTTTQQLEKKQKSEKNENE